MQKINMGRVIVGGIVAGIVLNVIDYVVNGVVLAAQWAEASKKLNTGVDAMATNAVIGYVGGDMLMGILIVWIYAAIRPRFGPGGSTAAKAAITSWIFGAVFGTQMVLLGMYPAHLVLTSSLGSLVGMLAGAYAGAMLYKE